MLSQAKVIVFDLYGTLIKVDKRDGEIRQGLPDLLKSLEGRSTAVFSDGDSEVVHESLVLAKLDGSFDAVYDARNCMSKRAYKIQDAQLKEVAMRMGGLDLKNLAYVSEQFQVKPSEIIMIGDNGFGRDKESAEFYGTHFIQVPQFRENPPRWQDKERWEDVVVYENPERPFDFRQLLTGSYPNPL